MTACPKCGFAPFPKKCAFCGYTYDGQQCLPGFDIGDGRGGNNAEVGILVFSPEKKRRKNNSFVGNDNIGILTVKRILEDSGFKIDFCTHETSNEYKIVLVSLASVYDIYAFKKIASKWSRGGKKA